MLNRGPSARGGQGLAWRWWRRWGGGEGAGAGVLYGVELCEPCSYLASIIHKSVLPEMTVSAGLRATVIESGEIKAGDSLGEIGSAA